MAANRELVNAQEQLGQITEILSSGDQNLVSAFINEYQRASAQYQQQQSNLYLPGPGQTPMLMVPRADSDAEYWLGRMREIQSLGLPPVQKVRDQVAQGYAEFPEAALMHLISMLPDE